MNSVLQFSDHSSAQSISFPTWSPCSPTPLFHTPPVAQPSSQLTQPTHAHISTIAYSPAPPTITQSVTPSTQVPVSSTLSIESSSQSTESSFENASSAQASHTSSPHNSCAPTNSGAPANISDITPAIALDNAFDIASAIALDNAFDFAPSPSLVSDHSLSNLHPMQTRSKF
ncbi:hypothetical protein U1Q18_047704, partial [Sarracenia purpurea var. burkii]